MIEIKNGLIYVEGVETIDPELIGYAVLDLVDKAGDAIDNGVLCVATLNAIENEDQGH